MPQARPVWPIGHQAPRFDIHPVKVDRRQLCLQRPGIDLNSIGVVEGFTRNNQCIGTTLERLDSGRDILRTADFNYSDVEAEPPAAALTASVCSAVTGLPIWCIIAKRLCFGRKSRNRSTTF